MEFIKYSSLKHIGNVKLHTKLICKLNNHDIEYKGSNALVRRSLSTCYVSFTAPTGSIEINA